MGKVKVYHYKDISYVRISELPISEEHKNEFCTWMNGQTFPVIKKAPDATYSWDYQRWFDMKFHGKRTYWD